MRPMTASEARKRLARAAAASGPPSSDYDLNPDVVLPAGRSLRPAGVLVGVLERGEGPELLLTKRSSRLKHHPGQIAFPGGKVDEGDAGSEGAALREAEEEVGLDRRNVEVLGSLPPHETVTGFTVTPVLGWIAQPFTPLPQAGEVDEVFFAPLSFVLDPANFVTEARRWRGQRRYYYAVPLGPVLHLGCDRADAARPRRPDGAVTRVSGDWLTRPATIAVLDMLEGAGKRALFVGGCVRDALSGRAVADVDLSTDALPKETLMLAEEAGLKAIPTGADHGTVTVVSEGTPFEVTTFRRDVETDGRRAVVAFSSRIEDDAARRDFTMNALYANRSGAVLDPVGQGVADLAAGRVRFIGWAEDRIREDYLRILRFFRFHAWFGGEGVGFDADPLAAIAANAVGLDTLPPERIGQEMRKLLAAPNPAPSLATMGATGVLQRLLPGAVPETVSALVALEEAATRTPSWVRRLAALGGGAPGRVPSTITKRSARPFASAIARRQVHPHPRCRLSPRRRNGNRRRSPPCRFHGDASRQPRRCRRRCRRHLLRFPHRI